MTKTQAQILSDIDYQNPGQIYQDIVDFMDNAQLRAALATGIEKTFFDTLETVLNNPDFSAARQFLDENQWIRLAISTYINPLPGKVYIADGLTMAPSQSTISGAASYPNDDFAVTGSGTIGTTTFTRSGGDALTDLGTGSVFVVMEDASGNLEMNVTKGYSGSDVSLWFPLGITPTTMHQGHGAALGQHLSGKGNAFHAQWVKSLQKQYTYKQKAVHALWNNDVFVATPTSQGLPDTNIWQPYNGMSNALFYAEAAQGMSGTTASGAILRQSRYTVTPYTDAQGEGMVITVDTSGITGKACLTFTMGGNSDADTLAYEILEDAVQAAQDDVNAILRRIDHVFENVDEIVVRITRTNADTVQRRLAIGDFSISLLSDIAGEETDTVVGSTDRVLLLGDSWFDDAGSFGLAFQNEFESGFSGTVINEAIGGSQITAWMDSVAGWVAEHSPDLAIIHTGINERNNAMEANTFWGHMNTVVNTLVSKGVNVLILQQGATASATQTLEICDLVWVHRKFGSSSFTPYEDRWPKLQGEFITRSNAAEFTDSDSVINNRNKVPTTRVVERLSDSANLTPTGTDPSDAWEAA